MDFKSFKKNQTSLLKSVVESATSPTNKSFNNDDRFWSISKDTSGEGAASIRILPQRDMSKSPFAFKFVHNFKFENKWFIENCAVTLGEKCPVCEYSSSIWSTNEPEARAHWRGKQYICNILVEDDPGKPENNGKVFLFRFGKKIYDMFMEAIHPEDEDDMPKNIFDFDEGFTFKMKLTQKSGHNNYDKSKFSNRPSSIADGDLKEQENIFNSIYELDEFVQPKVFKSYTEMQEKLNSFHQAVGKALPTLQEEISNKKSESPTINTKVGVEEEELEEDDNIDFDALLAEDD